LAFYILKNKDKIKLPQAPPPQIQNPPKEDELNKSKEEAKEPK